MTAYTSDESPRGSAPSDHSTAYLWGGGTWNLARTSSASSRSAPSHAIQQRAHTVPQHETPAGTRAPRPGVRSKMTMPWRNTKIQATRDQPCGRTLDYALRPCMKQGGLAGGSGCALLKAPSFPASSRWWEAGVSEAEQHALASERCKRFSDRGERRSRRLLLSALVPAGGAGVSPFDAMRGRRAEEEDRRDPARLGVAMEVTSSDDPSRYPPYSVILRPNRQSRSNTEPEKGGSTSSPGARGAAA